jgi:acyl dehydratase
MTPEATVRIFRDVTDLEAAVGVELGPTDWLRIDQARVDGFAEATEDRQWIHVDPERAAEGPFGTTIAHGYLSLSLIPYFAGSLRRIDGARMGVNYGLERVRFPAPVAVGSRVRARATMRAVEKLPGDAVQIIMRTTVEIEGLDKPACVADTVSRYYF